MLERQRLHLGDLCHGRHELYGRTWPGDAHDIVNTPGSHILCCSWYWSRMVQIYIYIYPRMSVQEFNGHSVIFSCFLQGNGRKTRVAYSFICLFSINLWKCPWQVFFRSICAYLPAARCIENPYGCIVKYQCKQHLLIHKHPWGIHVPGSRFGGPQNFLPPSMMTQRLMVKRSIFWAHWYNILSQTRIPTSLYTFLGFLYYFSIVSCCENWRVIMRDPFPTVDSFAPFCLSTSTCCHFTAMQNCQRWIPDVWEETL